MSIPIVYVSTRQPSGVDRTQGPMLVLAYDAWNDYSYQTMFSAFRVDQNGNKLIGSVRILYEGQTTETATSELLASAPQAPQGGHVFSLEDRAYLSLGEKISYYTALKDAFPEQSDWESILFQLNDTVFLEHKDPSNANLKLRYDQGFRISLLRGDDETRAYGEARQKLYPEQFREDRFNFRMKFKLPHFAAPHDIDFRFDSDPARPTNTAVLIGPNGLGKTQALVRLALALIRDLGIDTKIPTEVAQLNPIPPFRRVVAVSFSPFETFPLSPSRADLTTSEGPILPSRSRYSYCGFRSNQETGQKIAWIRAWESLIRILEYDDSELVGRPKFPNLMRVLEDGLNYIVDPRFRTTR